MRLSSPLVVVTGIGLVFALGCGDVTNIHGGTSGGVYVGTGDCSNYGDACMGESPYDGAFEFVVLPFDRAYSVTFEVTFKDAVGGTDDIVETVEVYPDYDQEFWMWSPSAPPTGYVEVRGWVNLEGGSSVPLFCSQAPAGDWAAYNNLYEVQADDHYSSSTGCYAKADLDRIVD